MNTMYLNPSVMPAKAGTKLHAENPGLDPSLRWDDGITGGFGQNFESDSVANLLFRELEWSKYGGVRSRLRHT